jgi:hypothetical protein
MRPEIARWKTVIESGLARIWVGKNSLRIKFLARSRSGRIGDISAIHMDYGYRGDRYGADICRWI